MEKEVRIDKWLWAVRIFKTRSQATEACRKGHVSIGELPLKPSRIVKQGEIVNVRKSPIIRSFQVLELAEKRMSAKLADKFVKDVTSPEQLEILEMQKNMSWFNRQKGTGLLPKKTAGNWMTFLTIKMEIMFIAQKKRKENIAEYVLYMFQVEDLIRAFKLDIKLIEEQLVSRYDVDDIQYEEVVAWYTNLVEMMKKEGVVNSGHLQFLTNLINDLNEFHLRVIKEQASPEYLAIFNENIGLINEFRLKGNATANDIETCLNGIYGYLLLKIQKKEISEGTKDAVKQFGKILGQLSALYKKFEKGDFEL